MKASKIRQSFIDYFQDRDHKFIRSSPVIPADDPTLLFINAGMNQFKTIFLNQTEQEYHRAVNSQKCIRVSGKHNDLEEVGVDTFHHTFFEMLGNWSFGDYYKKEAIEWAWELFTDVWKLDKNRIWATVFEDDDEAFDLWTAVTDISTDRVLRFGKKDNYWEMGDTGPCGPCSEIHYYIGEDPANQEASNVNVTEEYWELWNLVFIQSNRKDDGSLDSLPLKHVDTGAGLERIATILQGKTSNYDTDLFQPIIQRIESLMDSSYQEDPTPHRVIADHIRMLCFSIADGALPSNDGRGYVIRRILRRAARFGRMLDRHDPFLYELVATVGDVMGDVFPEVVDKRSHIEKVIKAEEESFNETLDRGINHFEKISAGLTNSKISGDEAFKLYDTYGFPLDLTQLMARDRGLTVDEDGFNHAMADQKERAKAAGKFSGGKDKIEWIDLTDGKDSEFLGYDTLESNSRIRRYAEQDDQILVVLDQTPFYAESGGQVGDTGEMTSGGIALQVLDVVKENGVFIHICFGTIDGGNEVTCKVNVERRKSIMKNHTATHLMHKALKDVLGDHVNQAGSLVHSDYMRFDLTHFEKLTMEQIRDIENKVNEQILLNKELTISIKGFDEAKEAGAEALFGEKYGDEVRVIQVGDYSMELCGGTHVERTGDIGLFKILEESSLSSGVRRIMAITGKKTVDYLQDTGEMLDALQVLLSVPYGDMVDRVEKLLQEKKDLEKKMKHIKRDSDPSADSLLQNTELMADSHILVSRLNTDSMEGLKSIGDGIFSKLSSGIAVLFSEGEEKPSAVVIVTQDLNAKGILAGNLAMEIGGFMGGGGGGKPHLATAGGKDNHMIDDAMEKTKDLIKNIIEKA